MILDLRTYTRKVLECERRKSHGVTLVGWREVSSSLAHGGFRMSLAALPWPLAGMGSGGTAEPKGLESEEGTGEVSKRGVVPVPSVLIFTDR